MATRKSTTTKKSTAAPTKRSTGSAPKQATKKAAKPAAPAKRKAASPEQGAKATTARGVKKPAKSRPTHEEIAARAAELWREHGGSHFDNWIRAERELEG